KGRVVEAASPADYIPNMVALARQGYDLIIGVGFAQGDAIAATAKRFPNTHFAIVDVDQRDLKGKPKNVVGLLFKEQEVGYLVGYLAALSEKRHGGHAISAVGGFKQPPVDRYIAGYKAGAQRAVPGIKVTWGYSQDWDNTAKCKELALSQIAHGSGVVFQVAGGCGLGALDAAREKGVWGIGVDADQSFLGPYVLTSAKKGVDAAVFLTIKSLISGTFRGGKNSVFGLDRVARAEHLARGRSEVELHACAGTGSSERLAQDGQVCVLGGQAVAAWRPRRSGVARLEHSHAALGRDSVHVCSERDHVGVVGIIGVDDQREAEVGRQSLTDVVPALARVVGA